MLPFNQIVGCCFAMILAVSMTMVLRVWLRRRRHVSLLSMAVLTLLALVVMVPVILVAGRTVAKSNGLKSKIRPINLYAIRAKSSLIPESIAQMGRVAEGDVLVEFASPEIEAAKNSLELQVRRLKLEKESLNQQPLAVDGELLRRSSLNETRRQQLQLTRQELHAEGRSITSRRNVHQRKLSTLRVQEEYLERMVSSYEELRARNNATAAEVGRKKHELESVRSESNEYEQEVQFLTDQDAKVAEGLRLIESELEALHVEEASLTEKLLQDQHRAIACRRSTEAQIALQIEEIESRVESLNAQLVQTAPCDGHVVYRNSSPNSSAEGVPLVVMAPDENGGACIAVDVPAELVDRLQRSESFILKHKLDIESVEFDAAVHHVDTGNTRLQDDEGSVTDLASVSLTATLPASIVPQLIYREELPVTITVPRPSLFSGGLTQFGSTFAGLFALCSVVFVGNRKHAAAE